MLHFYTVPEMNHDQLEGIFAFKFEEGELFQHIQPCHTNVAFAKEQFMV